MKVIIGKLAMVLTLGLFATMAFAQSDDAKVKIRVEKKINGKTEVTEKVIDTSNMSEKERDALIENIQDSLIGDIKGNRKMKVIIDEEHDVRMGEDEDFHFEFKTEDGDVRIESDNDWEHYDSDGGKRVHVYKKRRKGGNDWSDDFEYEMERLGDNMRMLGEEIPYKIQQHLPRIYAWTDNVLAEVGSSPIRSLDVFPNQPESDVINVRFYAPEEGDINISVLDTKGKIVAQKESKAFKGEYVGQINLKKGVKGTHFVIVSQGDDGVSRKVILD